MMHHTDGAALPRICSAVVSGELTAANFTHAVDQIRLQGLARAVHYHIASSNDGAGARACLETLDRLPEEAAQRVLRSPEVCEIVRLGLGIAQLQSALEREEALATYRTMDAWSSLGDVWLGAAAPSNGCPLAAERGRFVAPHLDCGVPVDYSLPARFSHPSSGFSNPRPLTAAESDAALAAINRAAAILHDVDFAGWRALKDLASTIVLRAEDARGNDCWGATSGIATGRMVVINAHRCAEPALLAEIILHEATHCALDCAEFEAPLLARDAGRKPMSTAASPWTGAPLSAHAMIHACAVWLVLLEFWERFLQEHGDEPVALERSRFIRRGFEAVDPATFLAPFRGVLTASAQGLFGTIIELSQL